MPDASVSFADTAVVRYEALRHELVNQCALLLVEYDSLDHAAWMDGSDSPAVLMFVFFIHCCWLMSFFTRCTVLMPTPSFLAIIRMG